MLPEPPWLIVGQGIAGTALGLQLENSGQSFHIVDAGRNNTSSQVAGGIVNPVTPRRFTLTWNAIALLAEAMNFYEEAHSRPFFHSQPVRYVFSSHEDVNDASARMEILQELARVVYPGENPKMAPYGYLEIFPAGWLDVWPWVLHHRIRWKEAGKFRQVEMENMTSKGQGKWEFEGNVYSKVIFCCGLDAVQHHWLKAHQYQPCKGQVLSIIDSKFNTDVVWKKGVYLFPLGQGRFKAGATYEWSWENEFPDEGGSKILKEKVYEMMGNEAEIVGWEAAIRPTTRDRRPVMGAIPDFPGLWLLNGLGARGVLYAPWMAKRLIACIQGKAEVPSDLDVQRWLRKH